MSADGFIAKHEHQLSLDWTSGSDKQLFLSLAKDTRTLLMGINTFLTTAENKPGVFNKTIPGRRLIVFTHSPEKTSKYANIETTQETATTLTTRLESEGVSKALLCGGAQLYRQFLQSGLVAELYLSIQPVLFGQGVGLLNSPLSGYLHLLDSRTYSDGTVVLHYGIDK